MIMHGPLLVVEALGAFERWFKGRTSLSAGRIWLGLGPWNWG